MWALVERAQAGEAEAFGLIYDRYVDTVFRFIYFRVGNRPLAEDLTADTFLRALKRISSFTWQGRDLGAWLVTIARNLVADHFKSGRYRLEVTTGDVLDADQADRGPEGSPEVAVVDHITNVALLDAVKQLNPEQQECIVLRFLQGFSVAETAHADGQERGRDQGAAVPRGTGTRPAAAGGLPAVTKQPPGRPRRFRFKVQFRPHPKRPRHRRCVHDRSSRRRRPPCLRRKPSRSPRRSPMG